MNTFNQHMLTLARDKRGVTQSQLCKKLNIGQGTLSKYENGVNEPPDEIVSDIANILGFREEFFYEPGRPHGLPPFHFRKRSKLGVKALNTIVADVNIRRLHIGKLLKSYELDFKHRIPQIDADDYFGRVRRKPHIGEVAQHLRELWSVPPGPIDNVASLIEDCGGIVITCDFGTDLIDAMSQRVEGLPVLFFVNSNSPADRVRFTLAHELGHMVLHTLALNDDDKMEDEADLFAGTFMVPDKEFKRQLRKFDLRHLANMKGYWKISMAALAKKASQMRLITPYQSKMFWIEMGKLGYRKKEPHDIQADQPGLLRDMIRFHHEVLGYSDVEMSKLLFLSEDEYVDMYRSDLSGKAYRHLQVVN